jgi:polar amino acid transport system substrate-binding protein
MEMKRQWFIIVAVVGICAMTSGSARTAEKVYINGIDADYPPFSFMDKSGKPDGLDVKALDWIAREMGFKVKHVPMDWASIIPSLKAKKIDIIASGMSVTPERKTELHFTIPYHRTVMVLVTREGSDLTVDQAIGGQLKWGAQRGANEAGWIEKNLLNKGNSFELHQFDSAPLAMEEVLAGNIDCAAVSVSSAGEFKGKGYPIKIIGPYGQPDHETAYAVRKEDKALLNLLNEGLRRLMATPYWNGLKKACGLE